MDWAFAFFVAAGFFAQLVDGALGMGFGVISTSIMLGLGLSPAHASASVHAAEVFTTAASGAAHLRFGNVDRRLFMRLLVPGCVGGSLGAYLLVSLPGDRLKPFVGAYLLVMGCVILYRAFHPAAPRAMGAGLYPLAFAGGTLDAIGGGGWGPIVTSTLVARGGDSRLTVGSVNLAEFFVTVCESLAFIVTLGAMPWKPILGIIVGGVAAAPLAAWLTGRIPTRRLTGLVGVLVILYSARIIWKSLP